MTLTDDDLDLLRSLDAAPRTDRSPDPAILATILATPLPARRRRLLVLSVASLAAAAAVAVAIPVTGFLGTDGAAYASWTADPASLSVTERSAADDACRDHGLDMSAPEFRLAERRGDWVVLLYAGARGSDPVVAGCMAHVPPGSTDVDDVDLGWVGGQGAVPTGGQFTDGGMMQFGGASLLGRDRPTVSLIQGDVGSDVSALTIHTVDGRDVVATVADGHYVAWWPGTLGVDETTGPGFTVTVTTGDGGRIEDAQPTMPR